MTIDDARAHLQKIAINPNAVFAHQDYVDEGQRLSGDDAAHGQLEEALAMLLLEGNDLETMVGADALMAISVRESVTRQLIAALPPLPPNKRDAVMRFLSAHSHEVPADTLSDLGALFMAHPGVFTRLALVTLPRSTGAERDALWKSLVEEAERTLDPAEMELLVRAAYDSQRLDDLLDTLRRRSPAMVRAVARRLNLEDRILKPLGIESIEEGLARAFGSETDPLALALLVGQAQAAECTGQLPRWLRQKDLGLLREAAKWALTSEVRDWIEGNVKARGG